MIDLKTIANNLEYRPDGIWYARNTSPIDYPEEGNALCFQVEESSFWFNHRNTFILEAFHRCPPDGTFFDIGGGNGFVAKAIVDAGYETVLIEPGIEGIHNSQSRGLKNLVCATVEDADFRPNSLPAAGMFDVLEHVLDDQGFLQRVHDLLIPGGRIYLTVPAYQFLWSSDDEYARHYRRYSLPQLTRKLRQTGFKVHYATYIFASLPVPIFFIRTLPSKFGKQVDGDLSRLESEHRPVSATANKLLEFALKMEVRAMQRWNRLPFGGSCLVVASAVKND